ncbi:MAG TPA: hypothetical protein VFV99_20110 [Kofleriaceae bacterium]|nr:hypothetical protein [Kofleriaceae bacterium]
MIPDGTCITVNSFTACGWATECDPSTPQTCIGTTLQSCVLGALKTVDCTTIGGTQCVPNTQAPGAWCSR